MSIDDFWHLVEQAHSESGGDMDEKCSLLKAELAKLPANEIASFQAHLDDAMDQAYTWPLWGAAYIMNGGCGDDSFTDFRATLISMGRETFESAVEDPESLANLELEDGEEFIYEGFQYVPTEALEKVAPGQTFTRVKPHPKEPLGEKWDEGDVGEWFPRLAAKYWEE